MEATGAKATFHSIHLSWDSFSLVFKCGILAQILHSGALKTIPGELLFTAAEECYIYCKQYVVLY